MKYFLVKTDKVTLFRRNFQRLIRAFWTKVKTTHNAKMKNVCHDKKCVVLIIHSDVWRCRVSVIRGGVVCRVCLAFIKANAVPYSPACFLCFISVHKTTVKTDNCFLVLHHCCLNPRRDLHRPRCVFWPASVLPKLEKCLWVQNSIILWHNARRWNGPPLSCTCQLVFETSRLFSSSGHADLPALFTDLFFGLRHTLGNDLACVVVSCEWSKWRPPSRCPAIFPRPSHVLGLSIGYPTLRLSVFGALLASVLSFKDRLPSTGTAINWHHEVTVIIWFPQIFDPILLFF